MIFTQEQIDEIRRRLAISGSKDSQLPRADLPLKGNEEMAIVQQGMNRRMPIEEFYEEFSQYIDSSERVDFFNVSRYAQRVEGADSSVALTLEEAVALCPSDVRRGGQIITFINSEGLWDIWQYRGTNKDSWESISGMWYNLETILKPSLNFIFWIGAGAGYSDVTINSNKHNGNSLEDHAFDIDFSQEGNLILVIPPTIQVSVFMQGIKTPLVKRDDVTIESLEYTVYQSLNMYTEGTHQFTIKLKNEEVTV